MRNVVVTGAHPENGMGAHPENGMCIHVPRMVSMHAIQAYLGLRRVMGARLFFILAGPAWLLPLSGLSRLLPSTFFAEKRGFRDPGGEQQGKDVLLRHTHAQVLPLMGHGVQSQAKVSAPRQDG